MKRRVRRRSRTKALPDRERSDTGKELGNRVRAARARIGMTRKQLGKSSGTSERYLAHIESGTGNPSLSVLTALAEALDLAVAELMPAGGERDARTARLGAAIRQLQLDRLTALETWLNENINVGGSRARRVVLVGLRGAGKSTLGKEVAARIGFPFFEISKEVEGLYGGAMRLLIELGGQATLHRYEAEIWENIVANNERAIIAAPGGIVADGPLYSRVLETAHSIWLRATPEDHMERVIQQGDLRPMADNKAAMDDLRSILNARAGEYRRAEVAFDTSQHGFERSIDLLEQQIRELLHLF